jgi:hypothetical protein
MPKQVRDGAFYEFNRKVGHYEVGEELQDSSAQSEVRSKRDIYTPRASDAKSLAKKVSPFPPTWHPAHQIIYFPHYYPGNGEFGHIFYGTRGEDFERP